MMPPRHHFSFIDILLLLRVAGTSFAIMVPKNPLTRKTMRMMYCPRALFCLFVVLCTSACLKKDPAIKGGDNPLQQLAPDGFNFSTSRSVELKVKLLTNNNEPVSSVIVNVFDPHDMDHPVYRGITSASGYLSASVRIAEALDTLVIKPDYVGVLNEVQAVITNSSIEGTIGGANELSGDLVAGEIATSIVNAQTVILAGTNYSYMGSFDNLGRPESYLEPNGDKISGELLSYINYSLPEQKDVSKIHPGYLSNAASPDLKIDERADVWITFVSEGSGNQNSIGYYTYPTNNPPASAADIDNIHIVLPNASMASSGGNLRSGDKVNLGTFEKGTSIGFVLFASGWNKNKVNESAPKYYTNPAFNPGENSGLKKHSVLLNYAPQNIFVVGFEDIDRGNSASDNDFNDVVFYASATTASAISSAGVQLLDQPKDSDGDGCSDMFDEFPNDASKAYTNYYPAANSYGTIAFEDNWPAKGDYDMNDLVINYRYSFVMNAKSEVLEMSADYVPVAAGASFKNGFGVAFPFSSSLISSVTGYRFKSNYIKLNANGTEAGQSKAVIIPFDDHEAFIKNPDGAYFINTYLSKNKIAGDTAHVKIVFVSPVAQSILGAAPFNPFLISNQRRGVEIHLAGKQPTDKADLTLFGTIDDNSKPANGSYYVSKQNWPWAIEFGTTFKYPSELNAIDKAYQHFIPWAVSGGNQFEDWYSNPANGYRKEELIYSK